MQIPTLGLIKLSFIFFYRRIFVKGKGAIFNALTYSIVALIVLWMIGFFFAYLFLCKTHASYYWTSLMAEKEHCNNSNSLHLGYAISDFLFDVIIILFPVPLVRESRRWMMSAAH